MPLDFWQQAAASFRFEYDYGAITPLEPEYRIEWRTLPFFLVAQVTQGAVCIEFRDASPLITEAGDVVCIAPHVLHRMENICRRPNISRWAHMNFWVFNALNMATLFDCTTTLRGEVAHKLGDIAAELASLQTPQDELTQWPFLLHQQALGWKMAALLCENLRPRVDDVRHWQTIERLLPALKYIEAHLNQPISREELARQVHLSPSYFATLFRSVFHQAPGDYVRAQQLGRAQQLLISTSLGVGEVARQCGFGNEFHFSRFFKAHIGLSPSHYRHQRTLSRFSGF